jgi:deferrochelatase/peroxidase EfeB
VSEDPERGYTRRRVLAGAGAAGLAFGAGGYLVGRESAAAAPASADTVPFWGTHQAGIATAAQDRLHFAAFDFTGTRRTDLRDLLRAWTDAAAQMTRGRLIGDDNRERLAPPDDTGEALGLEASALTITFGLGPTLFERHGEDRLGLRSDKPAPLEELPPLPGDELVPAQSGGDLCVQACAYDPQVVFHAVRNLARIARGVAVMRWSQLGFGRTSSTTRDQVTPRNLMGFKDGTRNIRAEDRDDM